MLQIGHQRAQHRPGQFYVVACNRAADAGLQPDADECMSRRRRDRLVEVVVRKRNSPSGASSRTKWVSGLSNRTLRTGSFRCLLCIHVQIKHTPQSAIVIHHCFRGIVGLKALSMFKRSIK